VELVISVYKHVMLASVFIKVKYFPSMAFFCDVAHNSEFSTAFLTL